MTKAIKIIELCEEYMDKRLPKFEKEMKNLDVKVTYIASVEGLLKVNIMKIYPSTVYKKIEDIAKKHYTGNSGGVPMVGYDPEFTVPPALIELFVEIAKPMSFDPDDHPVDNTLKLIDVLIKKDKKYNYKINEWRTILSQLFILDEEAYSKLYQKIFHTIKK